MIIWTKENKEDFEQKVAKEAKIWVEECGRAKFRSGVVSSAATGPVRLKGAGATKYQVRKGTWRAITLKAQYLIGLCYLCCLLFKFSTVPSVAPAAM